MDRVPTFTISPELFADFLKEELCLKTFRVVIL